MFFKGTFSFDLIRLNTKLFEEKWDMRKKNLILYFRKKSTYLKYKSFLHIYNIFFLLKCLIIVRKQVNQNKRKNILAGHLNTCIYTVFMFHNQYFFFTILFTQSSKYIAYVTENINWQICATLQELSSSIVEGDETDIEF